MRLDLPIIIIMVASIIELIVGVCVWLYDRKKIQNQLFAIFTLITSYWVATNALVIQPPYDFWVKNSYAAGILLAPLALIWILNLVSGKIEKLKYLIILSPAVLLSFLTYFTDLIIENVEEV